MENKTSFYLHNDMLNVLDKLTDEQAGKLFKAIRNYQDGIEDELELLLEITFMPFKNQFDRDMVKYQNVIERNKENGKKGGRPKKTQDNPKNPSGFMNNPEKPKESLKEKDKDKESDSVKDNVSESVNQIIPKEKFCNWKQVDNFAIVNKLIFTKHPSAISFFNNPKFQHANLEEQLQMIKNNTEKYN
jgi:hypothetical protein